MLGIVAGITGLIAGLVAIWAAFQRNFHVAFGCIFLGIIGSLTAILVEGR